MRENESGQLEKELQRQAGASGFEAVVPNPKLKLLNQVREVLRLRHYSIRTEQSYCDWISWGTSGCRMTRMELGADVLHHLFLRTGIHPPLCHLSRAPVNDLVPLRLGRMVILDLMAPAVL